MDKRKLNNGNRIIAAAKTDNNFLINVTIFNSDDNNQY